MEFAGRRFYDAGLSESVPYRTALAQGATHVLVLQAEAATAGHIWASRVVNKVKSLAPRGTIGGRVSTNVGGQ